MSDVSPCPPGTVPAERPKNGKAVPDGAGVLERLFSPVKAIADIIKWMQLLVTAIYDAAVINNSASFAGIGQTKLVQITITAASNVLTASDEKEVFDAKNEQGPVAVHVALQTSENGSGAFLYLSTKSGNASNATADARDYGPMPKAMVIVKPNQKLYANGTLDSSFAAGAVINLIVTIVRLSGRDAVYTDRNSRHV